MMQTKHLKRAILRELRASRVFALCVLCICLIGFLASLKFGSAALNYSAARNATETWQNFEEIESKEDYTRVVDAVKSAQFKHGSHPLYADMSGQVDEWGVLAGYASIETIDSAELAYIRASKLRPTWPVTWASLAVIKWRKQEFDDEMLRYLEFADRFGPQKPEVHVLFSQLGLALYASNHPFYINIREATQRRIVAGLRHELSRERVLLAIQENNALDFACIWAETRDQYVYNEIIGCEE